MARDARDTGRRGRRGDLTVVRKARAATDADATKQTRAGERERRAAFEHVVKKHEDGLRRLAER